MFTGIVAGMARLASVERHAGGSRLVLELPGQVAGLAIGASVAVDGVCLTVTAIDGVHAGFDVVAETLALTTLGEREAGDWVNVERSAALGAEIGGHWVSGHVDGTAAVTAIDTSNDNRVVTYRVAPALLKYILRKGFVALNGCSLTVVAVTAATATFQVSLIPETLRATNHGRHVVGDRVNLEIDRQTQAIVDTVERVLAARAPG
jgi:riboflavin synthase